MTHAANSNTVSSSVRISPCSEEEGREGGRGGGEMERERKWRKKGEGEGERVRGEEGRRERVSFLEQHITYTISPLPSPSILLHVHVCKHDLLYDLLYNRQVRLP